MNRSMIVTNDHIVLKRRAVIYFVVITLLLAVLACGVPSGQQATATPSVVTVVVTQQPGQTCGDGVCTAPEDANTCPSDCPATASPATSTPEAEAAKVKTTQEVRVRFGPSTNCTVLGSYPKDSEVQVLAKSPDGLWWQVPFGGSVGWLSAAYTTPVTDLSAVQTLPGPYCEPPTNTPIPPTETPVPPTFTPAPVCGNGVIEAGEECDTADTCSGIFVCGSNCKCKSPLQMVTLVPITLQPVAVCGNGVVEAGEQCDGAGTCGLGFTCNSSCQCKSLLHIVTVQP